MIRDMEDIKPIDKFTLDKYVKEEDDLLEYVKQVAMEFCPDVYECTYILETQALDIFKNRYNQKFITNKFSYADYKKEDSIQKALQGIGIDINKFWYLVLFVFDYSNGSCLEGMILYDSPKEELEKFINIVASTCKEDKGVNKISGISFNKSLTLTLKGGKHPLVITNPNTIFYIACLLEDGLESIEQDSRMSREIVSLYKTKELYTARIYLFAKIVLYFFETNPEFNNQRAPKGSGMNFSKLLLISNLIYFTQLSKTDGYLGDDDTLKKLIKQYKNKEIRTVNNFYL